MLFNAIVLRKVMFGTEDLNVLRVFRRAAV